MKVENATYIVENKKLQQKINDLDNITKRFDEYLQRLDNEITRIEKIK